MLKGVVGTQRLLRDLKVGDYFARKSNVDQRMIPCVITKVRSLADTIEEAYEDLSKVFPTKPGEILFLELISKLPDSMGKDATVYKYQPTEEEVLAMIPFLA